jgi:hypothetical protein
MSEERSVRQFVRGSFDDQHGSQQSRNTLPGLLEQLHGPDLLWVLNETVRKRPDLHNWIAQVAPPAQSPVQCAVQGLCKAPLLSSEGTQPPPISRQQTPQTYARLPFEDLDEHRLLVPEWSKGSNDLANGIGSPH